MLSSFDFCFLGGCGLLVWIAVMVILVVAIYFGLVIDVGVYDCCEFAYWLLIGAVFGVAVWCFGFVMVVVFCLHGGWFG